MDCKIKTNSREDENERHFNTGVVSEDIEGVTIDYEVEESGGNKKEKIEKKFKMKGMSIVVRSMKILKVL